MLKRIICLLMALIMCTGLFSCQTTEPPEEESKEDEEPYVDRTAKRIIESFGSPTEEQPLCELHHFTPVPVIIDAQRDTNFAKFDNIVRVKYNGKTIYPESTEKRAEYKFEVVEWLKGGNGEKSFSLYSPKHKAHSPYHLLDQSFMYFLEYSQFRYRYEKDKEYVVVFSGATEADYDWAEGFYIPLYAPSSLHLSYYRMTRFEWYTVEELEAMTTDEYLAVIKGYIERNDQPDSDSPEDTSDTPSDSADSASGG